MPSNFMAMRMLRHEMELSVAKTNEGELGISRLGDWTRDRLDPTMRHGKGAPTSRQDCHGLPALRTRGARRWRSGVCPD